jgi:hypothetical protein
MRYEADTQDLYAGINRGLAYYDLDLDQARLPPRSLALDPWAPEPHSRTRALSRPLSPFEGPPAAWLAQEGRA